MVETTVRSNAPNHLLQDRPQHLLGVGAQQRERQRQSLQRHRPKVGSPFQHRVRVRSVFGQTSLQPVDVDVPREEERARLFEVERAPRDLFQPSSVDPAAVQQSPEVQRDDRGFVPEREPTALGQHQRGDRELARGEDGFALLMEARVPRQLQQIVELIGEVLHRHERHMVRLAEETPQPSKRLRSHRHLQRKHRLTEVLADVARRIGPAFGLRPARRHAVDQERLERARVGGFDEEMQERGRSEVLRGVVTLEDLDQMIGPFSA